MTSEQEPKQEAVIKDDNAPGSTDAVCPSADTAPVCPVVPTATLPKKPRAPRKRKPKVREHKATPKTPAKKPVKAPRKKRAKKPAPVFDTDQVGKKQDAASTKQPELKTNAKTKAVHLRKLALKRA
jgi:hypothetical protein